MQPILFKIGTLSFPAYFLLAALAYMVATLVATQSAERFGENPVHFIDAALLIAVSAFVGAKLFHILFAMPGYYWQHPWEVLQFWHGGFVFYGGFIFGAAAGVLFARRKGIRLGLGFDLATPAIAIGMAMGRMACFLAGCCYGRPTAWSWPFAVVFHEVDGVVPQARPLDTPLIPTQIMSSLLHLGLFVGLVLYRPRKRFHGELFLLYLLFYSVGRFVIEFFRNDIQRGLYFSAMVSTSQIISVCCFVFALLMIVNLRRRLYASYSV